MTYDPAASSLVLIMGLVYLVVLAGLYVWVSLALAAVYAKLGIEKWKAWVPVYNLIVFLGLGGFSGWLILLLLIPLFGQVFVYVALVTSAHRINVAFGHGAGMTVLAALVFPVWASVLGFGSSRPVHAPAAREPREARDSSRDDLASFSAQFAPAAGDELAPRRDVPAPSAWIPPAPPAPGAPALPVAGGWGEPPVVPAAPPVPPAPAADPFAVDPYAAPVADPYAAPYAAPAVPAAPAADPYAAPAVDPYAAPAVDPYAAPAVDPYAAPAVPVDDPYVAPTPEPEAPAPVMSWWQPAIVEEEPPAAPAEPARSAPAVAEQDAGALTPPTAPPVLRDSYLAEGDGFPEASGEVSAVVGAPIAGQPLSAAASVAAARPGVGDIVEDTVIASRRRPKWALLLPDGSRLELTGDAVVLGRRPVPVHSAPGAQLVTVLDDTRTVSKTHALLRRRADAWMVSDLGSTNGVVVLDAANEIDVVPGAEHEVGERFLLGDAELRLVPADA